MIKLFLKRWRLRRKIKKLKEMQSTAWCMNLPHATRDYGIQADEAEKRLRETYDR